MQIALRVTAGRMGMRGAGLGRPGDLRRPPRPGFGKGPLPALPPPDRCQTMSGSFPWGREGRPDRDPRLPQGLSPPPPHTGGFPSGRGGLGTFI